MTIFMTLLIVLPAYAGYGDVDADGYPSSAERELHLWTNAARVAPKEFTDDYEAAGCGLSDFETSEKQSQSIIYFDPDLNEAARYHSDDMYENDWFDHDSSDGTTFYDRLANFYDNSFVGENIAYGYANPYVTVMQGWMCSAGHRSNIMYSSWTELGTGIVAKYYTQDFGAGTINSDGPVAMGAHTPQTGSTSIEFLADWEANAAPESFDLILDGESYPMALEYGEEELGIYLADAEITQGNCSEYYFSWETAGGETGTFPENGSYLIGGACDSEIMYVEEQIGGSDTDIGGGGNNDDNDPFDDLFGDGNLSESDDTESDGEKRGIRFIGCSTMNASSGAGWLSFVLLGWMAGTRRRR